MKYVLLIHGDEAAMGSIDNPEARAVMDQDYEKFTTGLVERGLMRGGEELQPTSTATTVRMKDGAILTTDGPFAETKGSYRQWSKDPDIVILDGPFAETKEVLGGFFIIECDTLDEAIEAASQVPSVRFGGIVEVRPIVEMHEQH